MNKLLIESRDKNQKAVNHRSIYHCDQGGLEKVPYLETDSSRGGRIVLLGRELSVEEQEIVLRNGRLHQTWRVDENHQPTTKEPLSPQEQKVLDDYEKLMKQLEEEGVIKNS